MTHPFSKKAYKGIAQAWECAVFALNIPMTDKERETIKQHLNAVIEILKKY